MSPEFAHCWATIFAKSEELVLAVDARRRILGVSVGFTRRFGTPAEDILGHVCANVAHEGGVVPETCPFHELILDRGQHAAEVHSDLLGGDFLVRVTPVLTERGEVEGAIHSFVEVTDQRRADAERRISEARFAQAQSVGRVGSWEYDPKTTRFWGSAEARRIYGFDPDTSTLSTEDVEAITPDRERVHQALVDLISDDKEFDLEYEILPKGSSEPVSIWSVATVQRDEHGAPVTVTGVVQDVTQRKKADEALRESVARQERITAGMIVALSRSVEARDPYTAGHERRVSELAAAIARELNLGQETERRLAIVGMLHDLGKVTVPSEILAKPGRLSEAEFELIKGHPQAGYGILEPIEFDFPVADIVVQHHERLDGSGYPAGLTEKEIMPEARILAVADVAEAMISHRPYRAALPLDVAIRELEEGAGSRYDPAACGAAVRLLREQGFAFSE